MKDRNWLAGFEIDVRWEEVPGVGHRCVGEAFRKGTQTALAREIILLPAGTDDDFRTQHGVSAIREAEATIRGRLEELVERLARGGHI